MPLAPGPSWHPYSYSRAPTDSARRRIPPISKLPDEILLEIVQHAAPEPFEGESARMNILFVAGAIDKRWREIVTNNTNLWTHHFVPNLANGPVGLQYEHRLVIALQRSGTQPLTFEVEFRDQPTLRFWRCWRMIQLFFLARCKRLSIISDDLGMPAMQLVAGLDRVPLSFSPWAWLGLPILVERHFPAALPENPWDTMLPLPPMPQLIELEIALGPGDYNSLPRLFHEHQPRLRSIHLNGTLSASWGNEFDYKALTNLHIAPRTPPQVIAHVISQCRSLQRLFIEQGSSSEISRATSVYPDPSMPDISLGRINLENLLQLRVQGDVACVVASAITAPALISLEVFGTSTKYDETGTIPPRYLLQLLRDGRHAHPALRYLSLAYIECSFQDHEPMVASELAMFLAGHEALEVLMLCREVLLPHLIAQVCGLASPRGRKIYRNWRLLHLLTSDDTRNFCRTLPDFKPMLAGNKMLKIEFGDQTRNDEWGEDEIALSRTLAPRVQCVESKWYYDDFAGYWVGSRIGDWAWDRPMQYLEEARRL